MHTYNPRKKSPQQLEESLVGADRWDLLETIIKEMSIPADENPKQHWMIIGPRGIGKSHLLTLLYYKVKTDPDLSKLWIPVLFPEELRMASNLVRFLERAVNEIIHELNDEDPETAKSISAKIEKARDLPFQEREDYIFSVLAWISQTTGKFIAFITENLQHLLGKKISLIEQKKLRAFLQTSDAVTLLGSATTVFNALHDHSHPFYHFFHIHRLTDLSFDDMKILINTILDTTGQPELAQRVLENEARLKALYSFTGGNPRMAVFLADILKTEVPEEMLDLMDGILDELTPYFETIFQDVPDSLEEVINTLAAFEPAQSPKRIAEHLEGQSTTIRNYLKQLKDNGYVRIAFSKGRSNYYCLNEYLYRIWFQMRDSGHREETRWLLELLLMLYSPASIVEEKNRVDNACHDMDRRADSYSRLIGQAADFMEKNPEYCRVIEWCVASADTTEDNLPEMEKKIHKTIYKLIKNKDYDKAIEALGGYLKKSPDVEWAYGLWGDCLLEQNLFEQAIDKFKKAAEINQESELAYWKWGACLRSLRRYKEAIEEFKKAVDIDPENCAAYGAWGDCLTELTQYAEAEKKYKKAIIANINYTDAYVAWSICLARQGKYDEAIPKLRNAQNIDKNDFTAYGLWGYCLRMLGSDNEAIKKFKKAIEIHPDDFRPYLDWSQSLINEKKYAEAIKKLKRTLEILPESYMAYGLWGFCLKGQEKYDKAIEKLQKAVSLNPKDSESYWALGYCLKKLERYDEAVEQLQKAIKINPQSYVAYGVWGDCLRNKGNYSEACNKYQKAVSINPQYADAYGAWGCSLSKHKKYEEASEKYKKAIENDPNHEIACKCYVYCLRKLKRFDETINIFKKHLLQRNDCSIIFDYGNVLLEAGKHEEAAKELTGLLKRKEKCSKAYLPYGRALASISEQEDALEAYLKYIKFNLGSYFTELDFHTVYQEDILPVLEKMTPGQYIEKLYTSEKVKKLSKAQLCMILVLLGKHEIVSEHIPAVLTETNKKRRADKAAFELLFFTIKFTLWIKLCEGNIHEALRLIELYSEYIRSLKTKKKKKSEVSSLSLGLLKLQATMNIEPDHTKELFLYLAEAPDVPFDEVLLEVLTCISEPDSLESQQFLSEKVIAEIVKELTAKKEKKETSCDPCIIC